MNAPGSPLARADAITRAPLSALFALGLVAGLLAAHPMSVCRARAANASGTAEGGSHSAGEARPFRARKLPDPPPSAPGFTLLPPEQTGIHFSNVLRETTVATNRLLEIGAGVALGDVDGDGLTDVYLCGTTRPNALYRNLGGWRFTNITESAGVACAGEFSIGAVLADVDGDDDLDLIVTSLGKGARLFLNDGSARFTEHAESGLLPRFGATSAALADVEGDGDLDLYVVNYRSDTFLDSPRGLRIESRTLPDGTRVLEPRDRFLTLPVPGAVPLVIERGEPDILYVNRGGGRFVPIPWNTGLFVDERGNPLPSPPTDWGLSAMFRDLNGDRFPDLYVCNDFIAWPDRVWLNENGRRFRAAPLHAFRSFSLASMAVDAADINRDGHDDLFVVDMLSPSRSARARQRPDLLKGAVRWPIDDPDFRPEIPRNTLHLARGDGTYAEIARLAGVAATDWSPAAAFLDVDLDGWEDLLVTTGNLHDVQDADALAAMSQAAAPRTAAARLAHLRALPDRFTPSIALRNRGDLTFEDASRAWRFDQVGAAHGLALGDLDNDGDLDVVVNAMNAPARIHRNDCAAPRIAVRLRGLPPNTRGVGARITVRGGPVVQSQQITAGGRFASGDDPVRVFAAGTAGRLDLEVTWRSGRRSLVKDLLPNHEYEILEASATEPGPTTAPDRHPLFQAVPSVAHVHVDSPFDDFSLQPLLPRRMSTAGPGLAWADANGDSRPDLILSGGTGGRLVVLTNGPDGFAEWNIPTARRSNPHDESAILPWRARDGRLHLIVGQSPDAPAMSPPAASIPLRAPGEDGPNAPAVPTLLDALPPEVLAAGPIASADVDLDGDLDVFIGGRCVPGRFPEPADSLLLLCENGRLTTAHRFVGLGMVSAAVFTDYDDDGDPDLALACHWDSPRILRNDGGTFTDVSDRLRLTHLRGWWNGITTGDFDGDGRIDLALSNWGRNWRTDLPPTPDHPVVLYHGDFNGDGSVHTLIASFNPELGQPSPWRERSAVIAAIPAVAARIPDHRGYGRATLKDILGGGFSEARELRAGVHDSMVLLHRGDHFEPISLPVEAQFAPAFGIAAADFNNDGHHDLFLAQNFFGVDAETSRHDAGTGLVLLGDGTGRFRALAPSDSGIALFGEQRACAVADFDADGRMDLAVAQHAGAVRLFRNTSAPPGLRVRLEGPPSNPHGVGAKVRLRSHRGLGPATEIASTTGYWSAHDPVLVLGPASDATAVLVRWPDGQSTEWTVPTGAREVVIARGGLAVASEPR